MPATARRRRHRLAVGTAAVLTAITLAAPTTAASATPVVPGRAATSLEDTAAHHGITNLRSARLGAGWLARQINTNGGYLAPFGSPDVTATAYAVLGLHAAGVGRTASHRAVAFLETQLGDPLRSPDGSDDAGRVAHVLLAAVAAGADPAAFGGTGPLGNLPRRILATARTAGPDAGLFGSADPTFDGAFRQGLVLAALEAAGVGRAHPKVAAGIRWLTRQQCANALWQSYRADPATPCAPADPATFAGPDTNSTSLAVQGLAAYGAPLRARQVLSSLRGIQSDDGGFPFLAAPAQPSDPNSTALTVQAIFAAGGNPVGSGWTRGGRTPRQALIGFQLGCPDPVRDRGAFFFPGSRDPNVLATVQAVPALAGATVPVPASVPEVGAPLADCEAASPAVDTTALDPTAADPTAADPTAADVIALTRTPPAGADVSAAVPGACTGTSGVTVAVDFIAFGGTFQTRCAPGAPATGVAALRQSGFTAAGTARYGLAFICRINNKPTPAQDPCVSTPPASAYWAYYYALRGATTWTYSPVAALNRRPPQGSIEAWAFGAGAVPRRTPGQVRAAAG